MSREASTVLIQEGGFLRLHSTPAARADWMDWQQSNKQNNPSQNVQHEQRPVVTNRDPCNRHRPYMEPIEQPLIEPRPLTLKTSEARSGPRQFRKWHRQLSVKH